MAKIEYPNEELLLEYAPIQDDRILSYGDLSKLNRIEPEDIRYNPKSGSILRFDAEKHAKRTFTLSVREDERKTTFWIFALVVGTILTIQMISQSEKPKTVNLRTTTEATYAARAITQIPRPTPTLVYLYPTN